MFEMSEDSRDCEEVSGLKGEAIAQLQSIDTSQLIIAQGCLILPFFKRRECFYMKSDFCISTTNLAFNLNTIMAKHKICSILPGSQFALSDEPGDVLM